MNRANFIHKCSAACVGGSLINAWLQSCTAQKAIPVSFQNNQLTVPLSALFTQRSEKIKWKRAVVIRHEQTPFPIALFRYAENDYKAVLLRCTHQGNELSLYGDLISCNAHGSEFNTKGEVQQGPADAPLHSFPVTYDNQNIYIQLA